MRDAITNYVRAGYPGLYLISHEEARAESELKAAAQSTNHSLVAWSATTGLVDTGDGRSLGAEDSSLPDAAAHATKSALRRMQGALPGYHWWGRIPEPSVAQIHLDSLCHTFPWRLP